MIGVLALLLAGSAAAQDCDVKQLTKDLKEASPVAVPRVFLSLADCDEAAAAKEAGFALGKTLHGDEGNQAALRALKVGAQTDVMTWVDNLEPDHRSQTMLWLGDQCKDVPTVGDFFVASAEQKTDAFLKERWYRGMAKCQHDGVRKLLTDVVEGGKFDLNAESKFGFIEVYARNLGKAAIPQLTKMAGELSDARDIRLVINAFADAANVGSVEGINEEAAQEGIAALDGLAPKTHPEAIDQVRDTLLALGDDARSDAIVKYRWPERMQDNTYHYAIAARSKVTCKNGKEQVWLHHGRLTNIDRWPDALEMEVEKVVTEKWGLNDAAKKCKGTAEIDIKMTPEPIANDNVYAEFIKPYRKEFEINSEGAWKAGEVEEDISSFF